MSWDAKKVAAVWADWADMMDEKPCPPDEKSCKLDDEALMKAIDDLWADKEVTKPNLKMYNPKKFYWGMEVEGVNDDTLATHLSELCVKLMIKECKNISENTWIPQFVGRLISEVRSHFTSSVKLKLGVLVDIIDVKIQVDDDYVNGKIELKVVDLGKYKNGLVDSIFEYFDELKNPQTYDQAHPESFADVDVNSSYSWGFGHGGGGGGSSITGSASTVPWVMPAHAMPVQTSAHQPTTQPTTPKEDPVKQGIFDKLKSRLEKAKINPSVID